MSYLQISILWRECGPYVVNFFELEYKNYKNKKYNCKFEIEIARNNSEYIKVFMKEQGNKCERKRCR